MGNMEKRAEKRILYQYTIIFRSEKTIIETALDMNNISMSGVYVATNTPLAKGTKCSVEIRLLEKDTPIILLAEGIVVRVDNRGQGIEFTTLDEDTLDALHQIIFGIEN